MRSHVVAVAIIANLGLLSAPAAFATKMPPPVSSATAAQLQELQAKIAVLQSQMQQLQAQTQSLQAQSDAQSEVNVAQAQATEASQTASANIEKQANSTRMGGRMFFDLTNIDRTSNGNKTAASGTGLDVKRFYLSVDHAFNNIWSANVTTDFQYSSAISSTELFIKKAYVQGKFYDSFVLRVGAADMPWIPFVERFYGYRYVENTLTDRLKYGNSSDWGLHAYGDVTQQLNYAVSVVNGGGHKNPTRTKGMDVEGRIAFMPIQNMVIAVGGYSGKLGKETEVTSAENTYTRGDVMVAYADSRFRMGGEYFMAKNLNNVLTLYTDKSSGWSVWGSVALTSGGINAFGRYDKTDLSKTSDPSLYDKYWNVGVEFPIMKNLKVATAYKYTRQKNNTNTDLENKEWGIWGDLTF
ncbi:MAG TPA: porin [Xylella taiwanensis]